MQCNLRIILICSLFSIRLINPYMGRDKQEIINLVQKRISSLITNPSLVWDQTMVLDRYYTMVSAKLALKAMNQYASAINQELAKFLALNGDEVQLVVNRMTNKVPIKNKYFIEIIDEFEKKGE